MMRWSQKTNLPRRIQYGQRTLTSEKENEKQQRKSTFDCWTTQDGDFQNRYRQSKVSWEKSCSRKIIPRKHFTSFNREFQPGWYGGHPLFWVPLHFGFAPHLPPARWRGWTNWLNWASPINHHYSKYYSVSANQVLISFHSILRWHGSRLSLQLISHCCDGSRRFGDRFPSYSFIALVKSWKGLFLADARPGLCQFLPFTLNIHKYFVPTHWRFFFYYFHFTSF